MRHGPGPPAAFLAYGALAVATTWPLATAPGRLAIPNGDLFTHAWGLAWVVHQAVRDPLRLYESNMYFPHTLSLAYTESLLPQSLLAAPLLLSGAGALLAHNLVLLLTFPLSGLGAYMLARDLSRSRQGAFLAGLGYAFCARHWLHLVHVGVLSVQWLPFALLLLRRAVRRPSPGHLAALVAFSVLQVLSSGYYAVLLALALGTALVYYARAALRRRSLLRIVLALAFAALMAFPAGAPYRQLQERHAIERSRQECIRWSARLESYLYPGHYIGSGLPHARLLWRLGVPGLEPLYPGLAVLILAAAGLALAWRREATKLSLWLLVVGGLFSLGPEIRVGAWALPGPFELLRHVPPANMMRAPSRLGILALLALNVLAAIGWARWTSRARDGAKRAAFAGVAAFMALEAFPFGMAGRFQPVTPPPAFTAWLARAPRGAVLELPWNRRRDSGLYLYWSTAHWQPIVNGHGSFVPPGNRDLGLLGRHWPLPHVARVLRGAGVRYVVVHTDRLPAKERRAFLQLDGPLPEGVRLAAELGPDRVYVVDPEGEVETPAGAPAEDEERDEDEG